MIRGAGDAGLGVTAGVTCAAGGGDAGEAGAGFGGALDAAAVVTCGAMEAGAGFGGVLAVTAGFLESSDFLAIALSR